MISWQTWSQLREQSSKLSDAQFKISLVRRVEVTVSLYFGFFLSKLRVDVGGSFHERERNRLGCLPLKNIHMYLIFFYLNLFYSIRNYDIVSE